MKILTAEYILPISAEPLRHGAVAVENDKIAAVDTRQNLLEKFPEAEHENFGEAVILPGFVNCHAHLELTAMRGFLDDVEADFYAWLLKIAKTRAEKLNDRDIEISAVFGALEGAKAGITCFADIGRYGRAGFEALKKSGLRGILFQETDFSPDNRTASEDFLKLKEKLLALKETETTLVKAGLSPHAPYTVSRKLFEKVADYALAENIKTTIHAAESVDEQNLMLFGQGFFTEIYQKFGVHWESPKLSSIEFLAETGILSAKPILAHCVKVSEPDLELIRQNDASIAHCPKSNAKFGHGAAPFEKFLDNQIRVGFGSDSVASNNICDILEEARFATLLARNSEGKKRFLPAKKIIETATLGGARVLGLDNEIGTLETGKQADLIVISLAATAQLPVHDIYSALLFASSGKDVKMTIVAGQEICRDDKSKIIDENEIKAQMKEIGKKMREI